VAKPLLQQAQLDPLPPLQVLIASLLSNCITGKTAAAAAAKVLAAPRHAQLVRSIAWLAGGAAGGASSDAVAEAALGLLTHGCADSGLRGLLASDTACVAAVIASASRCLAAGPQHGAGGAALSCLLSLCGDPAAQEAVARQPELLSGLLEAACLGPSGGAAAAAQAACVLGRVGGQPEAAAVLHGLGAAARLVKVLQRALGGPPAVQRGGREATWARPQPAATGEELWPGGGGGPVNGAAGAWADGVARCVAQQTAVAGFCGACGAELGSTAIAVMAALCRGGAAAASAAGNAALCLGHFAVEAAWRPALLRAGAVDALVDVAQRCGGGGGGGGGRGADAAAAAAAARNAAIALAKAAADPAVLARLRERRALEVFAAYVRP
jgi:hypothetical protein